MCPSRLSSILPHLPSTLCFSSGKEIPGQDSAGHGEKNPQSEETVEEGKAFVVVQVFILKMLGVLPSHTTVAVSGNVSDLLMMKSQPASVA